MSILFMQGLSGALVGVCLFYLRHFTSIQVVPLYMVMGIFLALLIDYLGRRPRHWYYPAGFYLAGVGFVLAG